MLLSRDYKEKQKKRFPWEFPGKIVGIPEELPGKNGAPLPWEFLRKQGIFWRKSPSKQRGS